MRLLDSTIDIERALSAVGELLEASGDRFAIVIVGGAALNLLGVVHRATRDVDVLAFAESRGRGRALEMVPPPKSLPESFARAVRTVAHDFGLEETWLNTEVAMQWHAGLPPNIETRVTWRDFGALRVGIVARRDLIWFKLFAGADRGGSHARDLEALEPTDDELDEAAVWVKSQDANAREFPTIVDDVVRYVRSRRNSAHR